ncbi:hypothetical protein A2971_02495 [Candidatus Gottesmanbacteria bacterium RIFCSPLOWO2_01_FULL_46_21]|uniref:Methyltransferase type 11 domain-containing protein n=1 Tax=Candidatus Gottesmanbacteria bacterium RIFCSPLOWO2_01_FULL_46_21 TaxID=1798393 RepID=A0A1F6AY03_9BACT|nr:MAG: hypothetical protein A2971_02495 [Candidatus Gottesmanbacteria bacterium RIFCSPLOWO2_01_FULL_46_21]
MLTCYLCQHPVQTYLRIKDKDIIRCNNCKLTYTPDSTPYDGRIREDSEKFVNEYLKESALYEEYFCTITETIRKYKKPQSLLDIGCGVGIFLQKVKEAGWNGVGVDISKTAVGYATSHGLNVQLGKIEDLEFKPKSFDVITLFQTIEHLEGPLNTLSKLYSLLRKGGLLILTTPSEESLMARVLGKLWFGYRNTEHLYFYNKQSLATMQKKVGFKEITIQSEHGRKLSVPWVLTRIFEYYYNQESFPISLVLKSKPYWNYLNWMTFREPDVNLISIAVK